MRFQCNEMWYESGKDDVWTGRKVEEEEVLKDDFDAVKQRMGRGTYKHEDTCLSTVSAVEMTHRFIFLIETLRVDTNQC